VETERGEVGVVAIQSGKHQVVIAVDPHKASWTAAAVDASLQPLASIRVPVSRDGYRALRGFARRWADAGWAIEGATGVGAPLTSRTLARKLQP
jgi:transposase